LQIAAKRALIKVASGKDAASMNKTPPAPCLRRSPDVVDVAAAAHGQFREDVFHDIVGQIARHFRFDESGATLLR
jgi:hypothetical protein